MLNRSYLSQKIFSDKSLLQKMNKIVHPAVGEDFINWAKKELESHAYVIKESALLVETGSYKLMDKLIVIDAPKEERIKRVQKRDGSKKEDVLNRMKNQSSSEEKRRVADYIIDNYLDENIIEKMMKIHFDLMKLS